MIEKEQIKEYSNKQIAEYLENYVQSMSGTFPNFVLEAATRLKESDYKATDFVRIGKTTYRYVTSFVDKGNRMLVYKNWNRDRHRWQYSMWCDDEFFHEYLKKQLL